ncbi:MAG: hypothetical protein KGI00_04270 [Candidatus Micrarchaeota archaeon]|nr:hypothetical protein [Candidatus Micrarchaeota archaeon]MDE1849915.1 hypothetical protein [Candidatus Micrarchaeota archaeon]
MDIKQGTYLMPAFHALIIYYTPDVVLDKPPACTCAIKPLYFLAGNLCAAIAHRNPPARTLPWNNINAKN